MSVTWGVEVVRTQYVILGIAAIAAMAALTITISLTSSGDIYANGGLLQGIKTDKQSYPLGECVGFSYAVQNRSGQVIKLTFNTAKQFDLWIERGGREVYRLSKGKAYPTMLTTLTLGCGETRTFEACWNQRDNDGNQVGPGVYTVYAQLASSRDAPPPATYSLQIGGTTPAVIPASVGQIMGRSAEFADKRVQVHGTYQGSHPPADDPNTRGGPPVTKSDWAICDSSGCMYVTGAAHFDSRIEMGDKVTVSGRVESTPKGQVYLVLESGALDKAP